MEEGVSLNRGSQLSLSIVPPVLLGGLGLFLSGASCETSRRQTRALIRSRFSGGTEAPRPIPPGAAPRPGAPGPSPPSPQRAEPGAAAGAAPEPRERRQGRPRSPSQRLEFPLLFRGYGRGGGTSSQPPTVRTRPAAPPPRPAPSPPAGTGCSRRRPGRRCRTC